MQKHDFERLSKKFLLPHLSNFVAKGNRLYDTRSVYLLKGIAFDRSGYDKNSFTGWAFVLPMFVPTEHVYLTFGGRFGNLSGGGAIWWEYTPETGKIIFDEILLRITNEAFPFFSEVERPLDFWAKYKHRSQPPAGTQPEACAYALILAGEYRKAMENIEKHISYLEKIIEEEPPQPYLETIVARERKIIKLLTKDSQKAVAQLDEWTQETIKNLGLDAAG